jgi:hypothetical protein
MRINVASLDKIYELWCAVRVEDILTRLLGRPTAGGLGVSSRLLQGSHQPRTVVFPDGTKLHVQKTFFSLAGAEHKPDLAIEMVRQAPRVHATPTAFVFVLDAKYRLQWSREGQPGPVRDAVNAIHRYRDAIVVEDLHNHSVLRRVQGGAILYPNPNGAGREDAFFGEAVSAIALTPGSVGHLDQTVTELVQASALRLSRLGPAYPELPPAARAGTVLLVPLRYRDEQLTQIVGERWVHLPRRYNLSAHKPTHLAPYVGGSNGTFSWLVPILGWRVVAGSEIAARARFGGGRAGRDDEYHLIELGAPEQLSPPIRRERWVHRGPAFVPLEIFDLAESSFFLRGDRRHVNLLRMVHHVVSQLSNSPDGVVLLREPILLGNLWKGSLAIDGSGARWSVGEVSGQVALEELRRRPIESLVHPLCEALGARLTVSQG